MTEQWRSVVGYEGLYEVSNLGRVRSFGRYRRGSHGSLRFCAGRILKSFPHTAGYPMVNLYLSGDTVAKKTVGVHRLVAEAFLGPAPDGKDEVNHLNGDKTDARPENLEWVTHAENQAHAGRTGLMVRGDAHPHTKLTTEDIRELRRLYSMGVSQREIGDRLGVSRYVVGYVLRGKTYRHVGEVSEQ